MKFALASAFSVGFALSLTAMMLPADAATLTFDWSATAPAPSLGGFPFTGSGTLTATTGPGGDLVTNITGSFTNGTVTDTVTGVGPLNASPTFMTNNLIFPIGTTFMGPPVVTPPTESYTSVANLDIHGLAFETNAGVFIIASQVQPNSTLLPTGNFYSQVPAGGGFGVGLFNLSEIPVPAALPLFATGIGGLGLLGWRRKRKAQAVNQPKAN
jgi:hypothetical protein